MSVSWKPSLTTLEASGQHDVTDDTLAVAGNLHYDVSKAKALTLPIHHTSTYKIDSVDQYLSILQNDGYIYSRLGNPSVQHAECVVKVLEGAAGSLGFASGMAAISTAILALCDAGDHIVCQSPVYSGTHSLLKNVLKRFNIEHSWVPAGCDVEEYRKAIKPNTKLLYGETPANPVMSILDLEEFASLGKCKPGLYTMVDTTFATPYLIKPCVMGVDITVNSATKYLGGHSDLLAGIVSTRTPELWAKIQKMRSELGSCLSPFDASLLSRGLKTLPVRMERHCNNADAIATFLNTHPKIVQVHHPSLPSHKNHLIAKKQMRRFGGMIAFELKTLEEAKQLVESVSLIVLAVSLGGTESLIEHPASMTHGPMIMSDQERQEAGITDGLIRMSVGLEDVDDLIQDLSKALQKIP